MLRFRAGPHREHIFVVWAAPHIVVEGEVQFGAAPGAEVPGSHRHSVGFVNRDELGALNDLDSIAVRSEPPSGMDQLTQLAVAHDEVRIQLVGLQNDVVAIAVDGERRQPLGADRRGLAVRDMQQFGHPRELDPWTPVRFTR